MAPPAMHPRSSRTSALFGITLLASFLVVGLPHVLPCPAPRMAYADGHINPDGTIRRRRKKRIETEIDNGTAQKELAENRDLEENRVLETKYPSIEMKMDETPRIDKGKRECPIPKPGGIVGELLKGRPKGEQRVEREETRNSSR